MSKCCRAPGCGEETSTRYSAYCSAHKSHARRHGAPDQVAVTKAELKPFLKIVASQRKRNAANPLWAQLDDRFKVAAARARELAESPGASNRYERMAGAEVVRLADHTDPREVVDTVLAVFALRDRRPARFKSDRAFTTQVVRRVRALSPLNRDSWINPATGRTHRAARELAPNSAGIMGRWLVEAFGAAGIYLAQVEKMKDREKIDRERAFHAALEALR